MGNRLARFLKRRTFDNRKFWNERYRTNPEMGSGPGSRGEFMSLKADLIRSAIASCGVESVLDVGCGDLASLNGIDLSRYTGIDISDVIVERNRQAYPQWEFLCADMTGSYVPPDADLVLCLDVLIHQRTRQRYDAILSKSLAAANKMALVSGFSSEDRGWNVFFYEAIADSIKRLRPGASLQKVAEYRGTDLFSVTI